MKYTSAAVLAALFDSVEAIKMTKGPDVYGPNGENWQNNSGNYDLSRIGINIKEKGKGPACGEATWATFNWQSSLVEDGRVIDDSENMGSRQPRTITVGNHDGFKCWELAFPHLHEGDKATLNCPSYYAYGGAHTISQVSDFVIPQNSDVNFDVQMVKCGESPHYEDIDFLENRQPHTTTMQPEKCFVLRSYHEQGSGNLDFVLTTVPIDGVRTLAIEHYEQDDKDQEWYYDEKDGSIKNGAFPELRVDASKGKNRALVLAAKDASSGQGGFDYTAADQMLTSLGFPFTVDHDTNYVTFAGNLGGVPQNWHIQYCKGEKFIKSAAELGITRGWDSKFWFMTTTPASGHEGFDVSQKKPDLQMKINDVNFPADASWRQVTGKPDFPHDQFVAEFKGKLMIDREGHYTFSTRSDDGSWLWVNDQKQIDNGGYHGARTRETQMFLSAGWHDLKTTMFEQYGGANDIVKYKGIDTEDEWEFPRVYSA